MGAVAALRGAKFQKAFNFGQWRVEPKNESFGITREAQQDLLAACNLGSIQFFHSSREFINDRLQTYIESLG